jgi:hypothetical protein
MQLNCLIIFPLKIKKNKADKVQITDSFSIRVAMSSRVSSYWTSHAIVFLKRNKNHKQPFGYLAIAGMQKNAEQLNNDFTIPLLDGVFSPTRRM